MDDVVRLAKSHGVMLLLDTVTSLGGVDVRIDEWGVDAAYRCSQKCIGSPPGLAPVTFSPRAVEAMKKRTHRFAVGISTRSFSTAIGLGGNTTI